MSTEIQMDTKMMLPIEFSDEIDDWVIETLNGIDVTADVLEISPEDLMKEQI